MTLQSLSQFHMDFAASLDSSRTATFEVCAHLFFV
jgi:hypothetical protein